jgi:tRNA 2-thiouridine synthesizing protein C
MEGTMAKNILIVNRRAPYGTVFAIEGFLAGIAMRSMELPTDLVLMDDGVWCAVKGQDPKGISQNSIEAALAGAGEFGLKLSVHKESLETRGIDPSTLIEAETVDDEALSGLVKAADAVMTF